MATVHRSWEQGACVVRILLLCVLASVLCSGQMCTEPAGVAGDDQISATGSDDTLTSGDDTADTGNNDAGENDDDGDSETVEAKMCYSGTFDCTEGPDITSCGTWEFIVSESDAIIGTGTITGGLPTAPLEVTLSGIADPTPKRFDVVITNSGGGYGALSLEYAGPSLELAGTWSHTDASGPDGRTASGTADGAPCSNSP